VGAHEAEVDDRVEDREPGHGIGCAAAAPDEGLVGFHRGGMVAAGQTSRREKIQTAAPSPTAIQAMIHTRYSGSGGSAAKNGLLAAAAPAVRTAVMMPSGSSAQIAPRHMPSVGRMSLVAVPTCCAVVFCRTAPTPPTMPPIHATPQRMSATTPPTIPARRVDSASA